MSLFAEQESENKERVQPLAARMRPRRLPEFLGQQHFLAPGKLLYRLIQADRLGSLIFYGPPGTGKTTLAYLLASETKRRFVSLSAIEHGVADVRRVLQQARDEVATSGTSTLVMIDEIHRFNRAQQDSLLADVEHGTIVLIGVTTSNPFFAVNPALLSRSHVLQFEPLSVDDVVTLLQRALDDNDRGLGRYRVSADVSALQVLAELCDGDARRALSALEIAVLSSAEPVQFDEQLARESLARRVINYDAQDTHYDCASALIKSIRGSDPDAALYWTARMLEGGEDIRFLCRRLVILASEDVGNADPQALVLAVACFQACEQIGLPECQLTLAQTVTYLACAPKSNSATAAIAEALKDVREGRIAPVPRHLRESHYAGARKLGHGQGYQYSHDAPDAIAAQQYLGVQREYYHPSPRGFEAELGQRLEAIRQRLRREPEDPVA